MITNISGGAPGAADAAMPAKQVVTRNGDSQSGFSDTLSGLRREQSTQQQQSGTAANDEGHESAPGGSSDQAAETAASETPASRKPIIDIRSDSLRRLPKEQAVASETNVPVETKTADDRPLTAAEKKLRDALTAAKAVARKSDEDHGKHAAKNGAVVDATAAADAAPANVDTSILSVDDAKLKDILPLLTSAPVVTGEAGAALMPKGFAAQGKVAKAKDGADAGEAKAVVDTGIAGGETRRVGLAHTPSRADDASMPTDPAADAVDTRQFRFTSARNEGQSIGMHVESGSQSQRATAEFKQSSGGEAITVLDNRRFLALAPNSNGANLTAMMSGDSEWAAAMHPASALSNAAAQSSAGNVVNTLKLQMNPHDLGSVTATLRLHGDELNVHLTVETRAAYRQLSEDGSGILDALRAQGFSVDQVTISIAASGDSDTSNNQQQSGQSSGQSSGQTGQQAAADGGRQGFAAGRGQEQPEGRQAREQGIARTSNDAVSENTPVSGSGSARPDQLYL